MPSKILLISTNRCTTPEPVFPLGLAYLSAALRRAGHEVRWLDCQADSAESLGNILDTFKPQFIGLSLRNIDDVLIRRQETFFPDLVSLCQSIRKQTDCPLILGGSGFSIFPEQLMELTGADFGIRGEGENSFVRLIEGLENREISAHQQPLTPALSPSDGERGNSIPGLFVRSSRLGSPMIKGAGVLGTARPAFVGATGDIDLPDRPEHLVNYYIQSSGMLNLQTQRGCSFACCYCTYPVIEGRHHRRRAPEAIAEEFELLAKLGARYAFIVDSVFNSSPAHVAGVCEALVRRGVKLQWGCFLRPQHLTSELIQLMARAGLAHIEFGTDSFADEVLAAYGKGFNFDDILESSDLARQQNIDYCHFLICGGVGETQKSLQTGFENSQRLKGGVAMAVTGMRIYPGTALCERALQEGVIQPETNLLAPAYYVAPGLQPETIYKTLNDFAHFAPNWIVGDPSPAYHQLVQRLRQRRVVGPLWSYFSMLQRLWPQSPNQPLNSAVPAPDGARGSHF